MVKSYFHYGKNNNTGTITEYASDSLTLPGYLGGEAKFIPFSQFLLSGSDEIMDMHKINSAFIQAGSKNPVQVGIMIGGIVSQYSQTQVRSQTQTNPYIYNVLLTPLPQPQAPGKSQPKAKAKNKYRLQNKNLNVYNV